MDKVLILDLGNESTDLIYSFLLGKLEEGRLAKVSVNEQTKGDYLLIPDSGGLNCNTQAFMPHYRVPPRFPGQHQWLEFWRIERAHDYVNSGIRMVGFGTSAFLLYDTGLGGKIELNDSNELRIIENKSLALVEGNKWSSSLHTGYIGDSIKWSLSDFYSLLTSAKRGPNDGDELVTANVGTPVVPPIVRLKPLP